MEVDSPKVWHFLGQILAQIFAGSDVEFELSHLVDALSTAGENTPKILLGLLEAVPPSSLAEFVGRCHSQRELAVHLQHQDIIDFLSQTVLEF